MTHHSVAPGLSTLTPATSRHHRSDTFHTEINLSTGYQRTSLPRNASGPRRPLAPHPDTARACRLALAKHDSRYIVQVLRLLLYTPGCRECSRVHRVLSRAKPRFANRLRRSLSSRGNKGTPQIHSKRQCFRCSSQNGNCSGCRGTSTYLTSGSAATCSGLTSPNSSSSVGSGYGPPTGIVLTSSFPSFTGAG